MFYIKGIGGYLCSTEELKLNLRKGAPAVMNSTALEFSKKEDAEKALATVLKTFGKIPNQLKIVEET